MTRKIGKWTENILGVLLDFFAVVSLFGYTFPKETSKELCGMLYQDIQKCLPGRRRSGK